MNQSLFTSLDSSRLIAIILIVFWAFYWRFEEFRTDKKVPKNKDTALFISFKKAALLLLGFLLVIQLFGFTILPFHIPILSFIGIIFIVSGMTISIIGRIHLGVNWVGGYEYQIKKNQKLVVGGIYKYIRHPIYLGIFLIYVGGQMVAESYLFIPSIVLIGYGGYIQGKNEEKLLIAHFKDEYKKYLKRSWMFIPQVL